MDQVKLAVGRWVEFAEEVGVELVLREGIKETLLV
ncbi:MAG: hypothetical protein ACI9ZX_003243 [Algoriphagus sp.]